MDAYVCNEAQAARGILTEHCIVNDYDDMLKICEILFTVTRDILRSIHIGHIVHGESFKKH